MRYGDLADEDLPATESLKVRGNTKNARFAHVAMWGAWLDWCVCSGAIYPFAALASWGCSHGPTGPRVPLLTP